MNVTCSKLGLWKTAILVLGLLASSNVDAQQQQQQQQIYPSVPRTLGVFAVSTHGGLKVNQVIPNSPAFHAGIRTGDIITHVAYQPVRFPTDIGQHLNYFLAQNPNGSVPIRVLTWQLDQQFGWRQVYKVTLAPFDPNGVGVLQYR